MTFDEFNHLPQQQAKELLLQCCYCKVWVNKLYQAVPFKNEQSLMQAADQAWINLNENDYLEAFHAHPKIGDINSLREKYANTKNLAANEQQLVEQADGDLIENLAKRNEEYLIKFGFIFIVYASGKTAKEILIILRARLLNNRASELLNAAEEQRKIFQLRLIKLFNETSQ